MTSFVRINYDRFINTGIVPGTDFENSLMDEILEWADTTLHPETKIDLPSLIDLYWAVQFGEVMIETLIDEDDETEFPGADIIELEDRK